LTKSQKKNTFNENAASECFVEINSYISNGVEFLFMNTVSPAFVSEDRARQSSNQKIPKKIPKTEAEKIPPKKMGSHKKKYKKIQCKNEYTWKL